MFLPSLQGDEVSTSLALMHELRAELYDAFCRKKWVDVRRLSRRLTETANDVAIGVLAEELVTKGRTEEARHALLAHSRYLEKYKAKNAVG